MVDRVLSSVRINADTAAAAIDTRSCMKQSVLPFPRSLRAANLEKTGFINVYLYKPFWKALKMNCLLPALLVFECSTAARVNGYFPKFRLNIDTLQSRKYGQVDSLQLHNRRRWVEECSRLIKTAEVMVKRYSTNAGTQQLLLRIWTRLSVQWYKAINSGRSILFRSFLTISWNTESCRTVFRNPPLLAKRV